MLTNLLEDTDGSQQKIGNSISNGLKDISRNTSSYLLNKAYTLILGGSLFASAVFACDQKKDVSGKPNYEAELEFVENTKRRLYVGEKNGDKNHVGTIRLNTSTSSNKYPHPWYTTGVCITKVTQTRITVEYSVLNPDTNETGSYTKGYSYDIEFK